MRSISKAKVDGNENTTKLYSIFSWKKKYIFLDGRLESLLWLNTFFCFRFHMKLIERERAHIISIDRFHNFFCSLYPHFAYLPRSHSTMTLMCELDANIFNEKLNEISTIRSVSFHLHERRDVFCCVKCSKKIKIASFKLCRVWAQTHSKSWQFLSSEQAHRQMAESWIYRIRQIS